MSIKLGLAINSPDHPRVSIAQQLGLKQAISGVSHEEMASADLNAVVAARVKAFADVGLEFSLMEGLGGIENIKLDRPDADKEMDYAKRLIEALGRNNVKDLCSIWMPVVVWYRTRTNLPTRGGATVTGFDIADCDPDERTYAGDISEATLWKTLDSFLREIIPVAEKWDVKMSLHPDDPPILVPLKGISRIVTSARNYQRVFDIVDSPYNTMTFCQANIAAMGEDVPATIRRFGKQGKITFVHFRDIVGDKNKFQEAFHDDGMTDMYQSMKAYYEVGFNGVMRPDHVPTMVGEDNDRPSYALLANLHAVGYIQGLMEAVEKSLS
ncbi:MAG: mannonate dehydratase [Clostridiales bacterium]|jgi:mannonate dehydratase|nr:mannonate dehydratase [Clostridiales bacterium]